MNKDFESAAWADGQADFAAWISDTIASISVALERLNAYQFDAPWKHEENECA